MTFPHDVSSAILCLTLSDSPACTERSNTYAINRLFAALLRIGRSCCQTFCASGHGWESDMQQHVDASTRGDRICDANSTESGRQIIKSSQVCARTRSMRRHGGIHLMFGVFSLARVNRQHKHMCDKRPLESLGACK